ncbi:uncharacterized protein LOC113510310 [Galleria mellonella]|uniref:Uncharacterized protein LOC113510310 n=1 Tax=Galleria mellonella TaxID=7137 RepID=A0ABM3MP50_GALME|nr:uncharacterized protein LOC113510310 [Galleria mellonella]XP_052753124.1 uncharacterized protein LOC113510310 [Galleria mellonella]
MSGLQINFVFLLVYTYVAGDQCIRYNFEDGLAGFTTEHPRCKGLDSWSLGTYNTTSVPPMSGPGTVYVTPSPPQTCIATTDPFSMAMDGSIRLNLYMGIGENTMTLLVVTPENSVSQSHVFDEDKFEWITYTLPITRPCTSCQFVLLGSVSDNSVMLLDSIRYKGPTLDWEQCSVYLPLPTPTQPPPPPLTTDDSCVTYDFENGLDNFILDHEICANYNGKWTLGSYESIPIARPHPSSNKYIAPDFLAAEYACICTFAIHMSEGGTVEVNAYMTVGSTLSILTLTEDNRIANIERYAPEKDSTDWISIQFPLWQTCNFGYIILLAETDDANAMLLIDSFRYIPKTMSSEKCTIYEEIVTTDAETTYTSTESTSTQHIGQIDDCITYNFENGLVGLILDHPICLDADSVWTLQSYDSTSVETPNEASNMHLTPSRGSVPAVSCIATIAFDIKTGGVVEVNVYIERGLHFVTILINEQGRTHYGAMLAGLTPGWSAIRFAWPRPTCHSCSIVLVGVERNAGLMLIDSFRYIPPTLDDDRCALYN